MSVRLAWQDGNMNIELEENRVLVVTIENTELYVRFISDLSAQSQGQTGSIRLSEEDKQLTVSKSAGIIFNPCSLDINNKKVITKLYQELKQVAENLPEERVEHLNAYILEYLDALEKRCVYDLEFDLQLEQANLFKLYNMKIAETGETLLERLIQYLQVLSRLCQIRIFFIVNLKDYLKESEVNYLYEFVKYEKIYLILLETRKSFHQKDEKHWILDKDRCIIEPDELTM